MWGQVKSLHAYIHNEHTVQFAWLRVYMHHYEDKDARKQNSPDDTTAER
jgi:hypothetical protein